MMSETETLLHDRYSIVHIERTSSFSKVFFALDTYQNPPRSCLIKIFEPIVQKTQIAKWIGAEFNKEAKLLKQLSQNNRHLPEIYTYSSNEFQVYYIVRELIEGEPLDKTVQVKGTFSPKEVREILLKLLPVLKYLHQAGVVHQNIKPKNIILRREDRIPMLINFGSIKHIVATYGFYRDKQIFSTNNTYGYAPSEQALGRSVPASDLYSLGLTALYLLTAKNPIDLVVNSDLGMIQLPQKISRQDANLAAIIARAITPSLGDRYHSAEEMIEDLQNNEVKFANHHESLKNNPDTVAVNQLGSSGKESDPNRQNWWKLAICAISGIYILSAGIFALYDWSLSRNVEVRSLLEPMASLPPISPDIPPKPDLSDLPKVVPPSMLNSPASDVIEIPIFPIGTTKEQLRKAIGEPSAIQKGYWGNSSAWIYKQQANGSINLGYLFDLDTNQLKQTEVAIAPSVGLGTIQDILASLLQGNINPSVNQQLEQVYRRQANEHSFKLGNLEGSIERESDDRIYLGVWQQDFH